MMSQGIAVSRGWSLCIALFWTCIAEWWESPTAITQLKPTRIGIKSCFIDIFGLFSLQTRWVLKDLILARFQIVCCPSSRRLRLHTHFHHSGFSQLSILCERQSERYSVHVDLFSIWRFKHKKAKKWSCEHWPAQFSVRSKEGLVLEPTEKLLFPEITFSGCHL